MSSLITCRFAASKCSAWPIHFSPKVTSCLLVLELGEFPRRASDVATVHWRGQSRVSPALCQAPRRRIRQGRKAPPVHSPFATPARLGYRDTDVGQVTRGHVFSKFFIQIEGIETAVTDELAGWPQSDDLEALGALDRRLLPIPDTGSDGLNRGIRFGRRMRVVVGLGDELAHAFG
ncbi:hypothetical protein F4823DRAFT_333916 [Ustulina deusta]|nr:hypothetical protein F4823DRAFT_333916 [Ustulina deusta]